jgi:hypothetical protein
MKTSESIKNLSMALLKAQKNIGAATKGAANPFFKSKYADLGSVMEACKEALNNEGITVLQPVQSSETGDYVETLLLHESGEFMSSSMKLLLSKQDMQAYGSAVSYARRYSLQSLVFIPAEDDDGEKSMVRERKVPETTVKATTTSPIVAPPTITIPTPTLVLGTTTTEVSLPVTTVTVAETPKSRTTFRKTTPPVVTMTTQPIKPTFNI